MKDVFYILLATVLTAAVSIVVGNALLRCLRVKLYRSEALFLSFVLGSGLLAVVTFVTALAGQIHRGTSFAAAAMMLGLGLWGGGHKFPPKNSSTPIPLKWKLTMWAVYLVFGGIYLSIALAPEASLDGSSHYASHAVRWAQQAGFASGDLRQYQPGGVEMLFLFAFTIGRHSATAMVELLFLFALPSGVLTYARRLGEPRAGVLAAVLFFTSPVVGRHRHHRCSRCRYRVRRLRLLLFRGCRIRRTPVETALAVRGAFSIPGVGSDAVAAIRIR